MSVITGSTRQEVMAKAILAACKPCGCGGSGSGSGSGDGSGSGGSGSGSGGGGGLETCCGCVTFPETLNFSIFASCIGSDGGTLTKLSGPSECGDVAGLKIVYTFTKSLGAGYFATGHRCETGSPANAASDSEPSYVLNIALECTLCPSDPAGHQWWVRMSWYDYSGGALKNIQIGAMPISKPSSCSPVVFPSVDKTVVCVNARTPAIDCYYVDGENEPWSIFTACVGSTFELDISE